MNKNDDMTTKVESTESDTVSEHFFDDDEASTSSSEKDEDDKPEPILRDINAYTSDFALPEEDQCIARIWRFKSKKIVQVGI